MKDTILIAGGSGMIGKAIYSYFYDLGYQPLMLSRNKKLCERKDFIYWDPGKQIIDIQSPISTKAIINLSGANIFARRWNAGYKSELHHSRIDSTLFLDQLLTAKKINTHHFISVSGSAVYGNKGDEWCNESDTLKPDEFITRLCNDWESAVNRMEFDGIKTILRLGIVLSKSGGALDQYYALLPLRMAPAFNKGKPYVPWIHIDDLMRIFRLVIDQKLTGLYNVSAEPVTSREFGKTFLRANDKRGFVRRIPNISLNLLLGERSVMLKYSQRMSNTKLKNAGFSFQYEKLPDALRALNRK